MDKFSMDFSTSLGSPDFDPGWSKAERVSDGNFFQRRIDGFRRDPSRMSSGKRVIGADGKVFDAEAAAHATADSPLLRKLKGRHLQMIAIGGSIGMWYTTVSSERLSNQHETYRNWLVRRVWKGLIQRWPSVIVDRVFPRWHNAVLHCTCAW